MIIQKNGLIKNNLYILGMPVLPAYLVDADEPAIFDAGGTLFGEIYINEINQILKGRSPRYLFLTHSHYDHCGSAAQLKKAFPDLKIVASETAKDNFKRPNVIETIKNLNGFLSGNADALNLNVKEIIEFQTFDVDLTCLKEENNDIQNAMEKIRSIEYDTKPEPKQPEPAYLLNLAAKINAIANRKG